MTIREVAVSIGGRECRISSDDNYLDHIEGDFEPHMVELFRCVAEGSELILDVGANIGCTAILFGDMAQQVHVFEPSPTTFAWLKQNVQANGKGNVQLHNIGLGAEAAVSTITFAPNNRSGGFVSDQTKANADHLSEQIEIRTLDDFLAGAALPPPDFIKIDVEGFEGHVLRGAAATLARHHPVVVLELNHWCLNAFQRTSLPDFFDQLRAAFPILYAVDGHQYLDLHSPDESYEVMYHHIMSMRYQNILCAFNDAQVARFRSQYRHAKEAPPEVQAEPAPAPAPVPLPEQQRIPETLPHRISRRAVAMARRLFQ
jgi:FkbM family methyltransferase